MRGKPYRVVIIEDSPEDREFCRRRIAQDREQDYLFWETGSGEEGLHLCHEVAPDCVLLDYQLPDLDGLEFLDRIQARGDGANSAIIMMTGHGNEAVAVEAMKKGADDYLVKGFNNDKLCTIVQAAIDKCLLRRQVEEQRRALEAMATERSALIAELRQQTAALSEANRRKDDFLAMLAHELRNPLAPLRNTLQIMQMRGHPSPDAAQAHALMERQVVHLARLVDDLLDVSRITRGKIELRLERVDVGALARRTVEVTRPLLESRQHEVMVALPAEPLLAEADPTRLEQILSNLLNNAVKYTDPGGRIELAVAREGERAVVRIRDTGVGIPPDLLPHVFELFTQGTRSLDRSQGGLGVGLTLVKKLVELHGGSVQVLSDGVGRGSEFIICVPAVAGAVEEKLPPATKAVASSGRSLKVLVVDDNVDAAESLAQLLRLEGHQVRTAGDGLAALHSAQHEPLDVVLLDIGLPGIDGYQVARQLREQPQLRQILLVALTGYGQEEDRQKSRQAGIDHHLVKPVDPAELQCLFARKVESMD